MSRPILIAYDGSPAADNATREAGALLAGWRAIVLVVWKAGLGFELAELPTATIGLPPSQLDIRTALEVDELQRERAQRLAEQGARLAGEAGFDAEALTVADEPEVEVAETIVTVARECDAQAVVVAAHGHGPLTELVLGGTSRGVVRKAECPVLVVREQPASRGAAGA
jgi:nucleotide-binding universal stress UspA family protein